MKHGGDPALSTTRVEDRATSEYQGIPSHNQAYVSNLRYNLSGFSEAKIKTHADNILLLPLLLLL